MVVNLQKTRNYANECVSLNYGSPHITDAFVCCCGCFVSWILLFRTPDTLGGDNNAKISAWTTIHHNVHYYSLSLCRQRNAIYIVKQSILMFLCRHALFIGGEWKQNCPWAVRRLRRDKRERRCCFVYLFWGNAQTASTRYALYPPYHSLSLSR